MKKMILAFAACLAIAAGAQAAPAKPEEAPNGCVPRATVETFITGHNFAELLRGEGADGKTQAVWTNGTQVLVVNYVRPANGKMDALETICVSGLISKVDFNFAVIEKLVQAATESLKGK